MDDKSCSQCQLPKGPQHARYEHPSAASLSFLGIARHSAHRRVCSCHTNLWSRAVAITKLAAVGSALLLLRITAITLATIYSTGYAFPKTVEKDRVSVQRRVLCVMLVPSIVFGLCPIVAQIISMLLMAAVKKFHIKSLNNPLTSDASAVTAVNLCNILYHAAVYSSYPAVLQSIFTAYFGMCYYHPDVRDLLEGQHHLLIFVLIMETVGYVASHCCYQETEALRTAILTAWYNDKMKADPGQRSPLPSEDVILYFLVLCAEQ
ncbi:uncharacterized protein LOC129600775 [Paramacrobiotus metropolitanus]|uniref:uncharacterized protein LOC129600775 n=1 Tax=Paramacrobiotus metropolitanus TaxID=2943436 RepID=UPI002445929B|nr:uncharacterized protein LOC129600775 [Paramacrobiotus metropolitanus]